MELPILKAVYSETLRLYVQAYVMRYTDHEDVQLDGWLIPKCSTIMVATGLAHRNPRVWNTGENDAHPVDEFWADRFLKYDTNLEDRQLNKPTPPTRNDYNKIRSPESQTMTGHENPQFNSSKSRGQLFLYGGGSRICPGRHFAKRVIMIGCAMMVAMFDVEILAEPNALKIDSRRYGIGVQHPKGKISFRVRRRQIGF